MDAGDAAEDFDYVVVGAGSAGCVVASRLGESGAYRVALLEAGGEANSFWIRAPLGYGKLYDDPKYNWLFEGEPEAELGGAKQFLPRGKVLGGTSSINGMIYSRGQRRDFEHWRALGSTGWGYDDVLQFFRKSEDNELGEIGDRGVGGPMRVSNIPRHELAEAFIKAGLQAGYKASDPADRGNEDGFGYNQMTIRDGRRCSTADAYLAPVRRRANMQVITHALATRVLFADHRAVGVEFLQGGTTRRVMARREVIIAGGVFNSPQLLQLSGIGPADLLRGLGIPVVADLPGVGENLQDHFSFWGTYRCTRPITVNDVINNPFRRIAMGARYVFFRSGLMARNPSYIAACIRTAPTLADPDVKLNLTLWGRSHTARAKEKFGLLPFSSFSVVITLLHPDARGSVRVKSADPREAPSIRFNFFTSENDRTSAVRALRCLRKIMSQPAITPYVGEEVAPGPQFASDTELMDYVRRSGRTTHHATSSCKMGCDEMAVVDSRLRVRGVDRLRVIDASIMPRVVAGNPNATTIMIGEKGAAMVLEDVRIMRTVGSTLSASL